MRPFYNDVIKQHREQNWAQTGTVTERHAVSGVLVYLLSLLWYMKPFNFKSYKNVKTALLSFCRRGGRIRVRRKSWDVKWEHRNRGTMNDDDQPLLQQQRPPQHWTWKCFWSLSLQHWNGILSAYDRRQSGNTSAKEMRLRHTGLKSQPWACAGVTYCGFILWGASTASWKWGCFASTEKIKTFSRAGWD